MSSDSEDRKVYQTSLLSRMNSMSHAFEFCKALEREEAIWNVKSRDYMNRTKRRESIRVLAGQFKCTEEDVLKKYANLRTYFRKELCKVRHRTRGDGDDAYHSTWPYFKHLMFMTESCEKSKVIVLPESPTHETRMASYSTQFHPPVHILDEIDCSLDSTVGEVKGDAARLPVPVQGQEMKAWFMQEAPDPTPSRDTTTSYTKPSTDRPTTTQPNDAPTLACEHDDVQGFLCWLGCQLRRVNDDYKRNATMHAVQGLVLKELYKDEPPHGAEISSDATSHNAKRTASTKPNGAHA